MDTVHKLVDRFLRIPGAVVATPDGAGKSIWEVGVREYVAEYPLLNNYPDYLLFLADYGGGGIYPNEPSLSTSYSCCTVFGFGEFQDRFVADVDAEGFFGFTWLEFRYREPMDLSELYVDGMFSCDCTMDVSGNRPIGIYGPNHSIAKAVSASSYELRWGSFTHWLDELVQNNGRINYCE
jgi:hypothetical protein